MLMPFQPLFVPVLNVIPRDLLVVQDVRPVADRLAQVPSCEAWVLPDGSLAYTIRDTLTDRGAALDLDKWYARNDAIGHRLGGVLTPFRTDGAALQIPDHQFWVSMRLSPGESESKTCCYMKSKLKTWEPFHFRAAGPFAMSGRERIELKRFLEQWIEARTVNPLLGEKLDLGRVEFDDFSLPQSQYPKTYHRHGLTVRCTHYQPCTWPWIDLYLQVRRCLTPKRRFSLEFFNPEGSPT